ncbi:MAG: hypothetical protein Q8N69_01435 [bacterium]|nr:hypothetical protein [bacterium]
MLVITDGFCPACKNTKKCSDCEGSGNHPKVKKAKCPTCRGNGKCLCQSGLALRKNSEPTSIKYLAEEFLAGVKQSRPLSL